MHALRAVGIVFLVCLWSDSRAEPAATRHAPTMQAAAIDRGGDASVLTLHTLPIPRPGANEVLIALDTAGVGIWDVGVRQHPDELQHSAFPLVLGTDGAGTIVAVGSNVHRFKPGDQVYSYSWDNPQGGFYAEYVAVPADRVGHLPKSIGLRDAGAIATTGLTAIQGVDDFLHLKSGETVLILGASGGVGSLAVEFAKLRGARVLAAASGEDGLNFVKKIGADAVVDSRTGDIAGAARAFAPKGIDAILALTGGEVLEHCIDTLRKGGRVAYPNGVSPRPKARPGISMVAYDATPGAREFERLNKAIDEAHPHITIAAEYPLANAAKAQERMEAGHVLGKIILRIHL